MMARALVEQNKYPVRMVCELLDLSSSSYYYSPKEAAPSQLLADLETVAGLHPTYGTRRITHQLRRKPFDYAVNRKRIQRLMRKMGLLRPVKRRKVRTTNSQHPFLRYPNLVKDLEIYQPDQVWASDITYIRLQREFVYLAIVLDIFTRSIRGWCLSRTLDQQLTLEALRMALHSQPAPQIHHSDQGLQYAAHAYVHLLQAFHVQISMATVGKAEENGFAERFMRTIKEEEVDLSEYRDFADALTQIGHFIEDVYNQKRIHSALGYFSPVEYELAWRLAHTLPAGSTP
jgi:transposase InsO family protein